jgi:hypothetical protein
MEFGIGHFQGALVVICRVARLGNGNRDHVHGGNHARQRILLLGASGPNRGRGRGRGRDLENGGSATGMQVVDGTGPDTDTDTSPETGHGHQLVKNVSMNALNVTVR